MISALSTEINRKEHISFSKKISLQDSLSNPDKRVKLTFFSLNVSMASPITVDLITNTMLLVYVLYKVAIEGNNE